MGLPNPSCRNRYKTKKERKPQKTMLLKFSPFFTQTYFILERREKF